MDLTNEPWRIGSPVYADLMCDITMLDQSIHIWSTP